MQQQDDSQNDYAEEQKPGKRVYVYVDTISFTGEPRKYRLLYSNKKQISSGLEVEDGRRGL